MSTVSEKLQDVGKQVFFCLKEHPQTRNDDTLLIWTVWREFHGVGESVSFKQMKKLPSFETIRRTRAKVQNDLGKFPPSDPVVRKRRGLEDEWKNALQMEMF